MAKRKLQAKRVLLTGASSGIGRELTFQLLSKQARVLVCARRQEKLDDLTKEAASLTGELVTLAGDITDSEFRNELTETAKEQFQGLDILINNAGSGGLGFFAEATSQRLRDLMEVNFFCSSRIDPY